MVLDWFGGRNTDVADLISRKKYAKAIEVMRAQFKQRPPGIETRLQFVDVLILAGRGKEAAPILVGLADELSADGQVAKAVGLLKRVEQIDPSRADVLGKLAALLRKEFEAQADSKWHAAGPAPEVKKSTPPSSSKATFSQRIAFDLEEIPEEPVTPSAAGPLPVDTIEVSPETSAEPQTASLESQAGESGGDPTVTHRMRGAFRRFLSSLPGEGPPDAEAESEPVLEVQAQAAPAIEPVAEAEPTVEPTPEREPTLEAEPTAEVEAEAPPEAELEIQTEPEPTAETTAEAAAEPVSVVEPEPSEPMPEIEPEPFAPQASELASVGEPEVIPEAEADSGETMSEETFQGQVLDLIEEVVQQPLAAAAHAVDEPGLDQRPRRTRGVAESAQRLVTSPLFRGLSEVELLAVVRGMRLHTYEAGDVVMTEGEGGDSLFIMTSGSVRMFVRNPAGHNFEMGMLQEGDFFGELSSLSGRPRGSTVVATGHAELLELGKQAVDQIARTHPRVRETLENVYIQRASSPEAAAIRAVAVDPGSQRRAIEVLEAYFGESRWDPRMRLRLADLLAKAGREDDAVPLLVGLADDLDRAGFPEKAIAILKKIEKLRMRGTEEVSLAPLRKEKPGPTQTAIAALPDKKAAQAAAAKAGREQTLDSFSNWMVDVVRDAVAPPLPAGPLPPTLAPGYTQGLLASPLFQGLSEDELLTLIRELRLLSFDPGDIIITEGEPGQSLFILTAGAVKVSVRNQRGKNVRVTDLRAGSFFGEMATVSGKPRSATVTAAHRCELLELDKPAIDQVSARHPRVREVLEEIYIARAARADVARARTGARPA